MKIIKGLVFITAVVAIKYAAIYSYSVYSFKQSFIQTEKYKEAKAAYEKQPYGGLRGWYLYEI